MAVTISSAVRTNLLSLQGISSQQSTVQNRLATGKKVNSALDNATSFFTASSFTSRAASLSSLQDSIATGVQTLQAANNGITSITSLVNQLRSTAQQALQSTSAYTSQAKLSSATAITGATSADIRGSLGAGYNVATGALSTLNQSPTVATTSGTTAQVSTLHSAAAATSTSTVNFSALSNGSAANVTSTGDFSTLHNAVAGSITSTSDFSALSNTDTLTINGAVFTKGTDFSDLTTLQSALNGNAATSGANAVTATLGGAGSTKLVLTGTGSNSVTASGSTATFGAAVAGQAASTVTINGTTFTKGATTSGTTFADLSGLNTVLAANAGTSGANAVTATLGGAGSTKLVLTGTGTSTLTASGGGGFGSVNAAVAGSTLTINGTTFTKGATTSGNTFADLAGLQAALAANASTSGTNAVTADVLTGGTGALKLTGTVGGNLTSAITGGQNNVAAVAADTLTVGDGAHTANFTFDSNAAAGDNTKFKDIADLNTKLGNLNVKATAAETTPGSGKLKLTSTDTAVTLTTNGTAATSLGLAASTAPTADVLSVNDGSGAKSFVFDPNATSTDNTKFKDIGDLNTKLSALGVKATATDAGSGKLKLTATDNTTTLTVGGSAQAAGKLNIGSSVTPVPSPLDGKNLTFTIGSSTKTVVFGDPATTTGAVKSLDDLNSQLSSIGLSASLDSSGSLSFSTTSATASQTFSVSGTASGTGSAFTATASSTVSRGGSGADSRDSLVTQYNGLLSQIDSVAKDANFNGLNLLNGDTLSLIFNETNTSKLDVNGTSANSTGLGLSNVTATNFNDGNGINAVLSAVDKAKTSLSTQASKFGSNLAVVQTRQDFTKNTINTLQTGSDNLVNADLNEEATNLLSLNTSQSLAQQALSLANQSQQSVLQLLR